MKDLAHRLLQIARSCGVTDARITWLRCHPCLVGTLAGRPIKYPFPGTPSDWRSGRNAIAQFYRYLGVSKSTLNGRSRAKPRRHRKRRHQQNDAAVSFSMQRSSHRASTRLDRDPFAALEPLRTVFADLSAASKSGAAK